MQATLKGIVSGHGGFTRKNGDYVPVLLLEGVQINTSPEMNLPPVGHEAALDCLVVSRGGGRVDFMLLKIHPNGNGKP